MNTMVWGTTRTGFKVHAFENGAAQCRKSIKQGAGHALSHADARTWVLGTPGLSFCTTCEYVVRVHSETVAKLREQDHVTALVMNEEFDAKAAPVACCDHAPMYHGARGCDQCGCATPRSAAPACICPVRTDYHSLDCMTFRAAHSAPNTDSKETNDVSIKTGPLTERQKRIITYLREGKRHEEIAPLLGEGSTVNVVKQECQNIRAKFRTNTVTQAVSLWATAQAYRETATLIGSHRPYHPDNETDVHVDHVLYGLMQILRERADRLTPR